MLTGMASTEQQLVELPGLVAQLPELRTTQTPGQAERVGSGSTKIHPPAPVRLEVIDVQRTVNDTLTQWCRDLDPLNPREDILSQCWYLRWVYPETIYQEALAHDVNGLYTLVREVLGEREFMWPTHEACGGQIVEFRCNLCLHTWGDNDIVKRLTDLSRTATLSQCSKETGVQIQTLEYWVREGMLEPVTVKRPKTYKLSQVEWLRDRSRASKGGRKDERV